MSSGKWPKHANRPKVVHKQTNKQTDRQTKHSILLRMHTQGKKTSASSSTEVFDRDLPKLLNKPLLKLFLVEGSSPSLKRSEEYSDFALYIGPKYNF